MRATSGMRAQRGGGSTSRRPGPVVGVTRRSGGRPALHGGIFSPGFITPSPLERFASVRLCLPLFNVHYAPARVKLSNDQETPLASLHYRIPQGIDSQRRRMRIFMHMEQLGPRNVESAMIGYFPDCRPRGCAMGKGTLAAIHLRLARSSLFPRLSRDTDGLVPSANVITPWPAPL